MSLVDIHDQLSAVDGELEKEAAVEFEKIAEEDAAGRIMARGFMDELHKLAGPGAGIVPAGDFKVKNNPVALKPGKAGPKPSAGVTKRKPLVPPMGQGQVGMKPRRPAAAAKTQDVKPGMGRTVRWGGQ